MRRPGLSSPTEGGTTTTAEQSSGWVGSGSLTLESCVPESLTVPVGSCDKPEVAFDEVRVPKDQSPVPLDYQVLRVIILKVLHTPELDYDTPLSLDLAGTHPNDVWGVPGLFHFNLP